MGVKKISSASKKAGFKAYKEFGKAGKNKLAKLQRHLKKFPNDKQAHGAVGDARNYTGRKEPKRTGARLNPFVGDRDKITLLDKEADMYITTRSLNLLNGRISAVGKRVQQAISFAAGVRRQAAYDRKGKLFAKPKATREDRLAAKQRALAKTQAAAVKSTKQHSKAKRVAKAS